MQALVHCLDMSILVPVHVLQLLHIHILATYQLYITALTFYTS